MIVTLNAKRRLTVPVALAPEAPGDGFDARFDDEEDGALLVALTELAAPRRPRRADDRGGRREAGSRRLKTLRHHLLKHAIPVLHVTSSTAAEEFYCRRLGFQREFGYRADSARPDPCYMGLTRDGVWFHLSSFSGDGVSGAVVFVLVEDVDALHAELVAKRCRSTPAQWIRRGVTARCT